MKLPNGFVHSHNTVKYIHSDQSFLQRKQDKNTISHVPVENLFADVF